MTCAKQRVTCTITTPEGVSVVGENWCKNPQPACPRKLGEDYTKCREVCGQQGHAEDDALRKLAEAGASAKGATATLRGHTYYCPRCQEALFSAGVMCLSRA